MDSIPTPPVNLSPTQWLIFVAIIGVFTLVQSYFAHRKIDAASAASAAKTTKTDGKGGAS